ncbi:MAG: transcription elongation factor GreA [Ignavibacteriae bacterium]|nr:transcription elongation factor GreA [Ignavibacteriota bacterium]MCB9216030.1 transcription elongation factor GreA [Ignavibacteria bacterium]
MAEHVYLTRERMREIEEEIQDLKINKRKEMAEMIAEARSHGDLSENAEYDAAKEAQGLLESRISRLEGIIGRARVLDSKDLPNDKVYILTRVKVKNHTSGIEAEYTLVSPEEADLEKRKLAITSPIGKALMGKTVGDLVEAHAPAGKVQLEVLSIERS